jgi:hypothetical protein
MMGGDEVTCVDASCRVTTFAATFELKRRWVTRAKTRGGMRVCPKCGVRTTLYHDGMPACISFGCRVLTFTGGLVEVCA